MEKKNVKILRGIMKRNHIYTLLNRLQLYLKNLENENHSNKYSSPRKNYQFSAGNRLIPSLDFNSIKYNGMNRAKTRVKYIELSYGN